MKYCIGCGVVLLNDNPKKRVCANCCLPNRSPKDQKLSTGSIGAIAELLACADLTAKGYEVYRATSSNSYADCIAIKDSKIYKIEVRSGRYTSVGNVEFPTNSREKELNDKVFAVVLHCGNKFNKILYLDVNKKQVVI